jgi:hypothetical protein
MRKTVVLLVIGVCVLEILSFSYAKPFQVDCSLTLEHLRENLSNVDYDSIPDVAVYGNDIDYNNCISGIRSEANERGINVDRITDPSEFSYYEMIFILGGQDADTDCNMPKNVARDYLTSSDMQKLRDSPDIEIIRVVERSGLYRIVYAGSMREQTSKISSDNYDGDIRNNTLDSLLVSYGANPLILDKLIRCNVFADWSGDGIQHAGEPSLGGIGIRTGNLIIRTNENGYCELFVPANQSRLYLDIPNGYDYDLRYFLPDRSAIIPIENGFPVSVGYREGEKYDVSVAEGFVTLPFEKGTKLTGKTLYVDLDPGPGLTTWNGTAETYNGHTSAPSINVVHLF